MIKFHLAVSLMLIAFILSTISARINKDHSVTKTDGITALPIVTPILEARSSCSSANGTLIGGQNGTLWTLLCDTDFYLQDIYPFLRATTFQDCLSFCDNYNHVRAGSCAGFVFAPDRVPYDNDCYLKSAVQNTVYPATIHLVGAIFRGHAPIATSTTDIIVTITSTLAPNQPMPTPATQTLAPGRQVEVRIPTVKKNVYLGASVDKSAARYVKHALARPIKLAASILEPGTNIDLITRYPLASDTGSWTINDVESGYKPASMTVTPRISRDGGRGGKINGTNVFVFCDTSTFGEEKDSILGYMNGFVSSSVAVDKDMLGISYKPLILENTIGQWQDDVGRMRGWAPMTQGEEAFNTAISGQGYRYAVWPNSSPISLNASHAIIYASLVYLEVDMQDQSSPRYTSLGNTLLLIHIDPVYGPHAARLQNQFFTQDDINWGSLGGVRSWSASGTSDLNGSVYLFGQGDAGILVSKVVAVDFKDKSKYQYWTGSSWSLDMVPKSASANTVMINQQVMNMDLFYSPIHRTFIMIYLTPDADNTFYYRYLVSTSNSTWNIVPPYEAGGSSDYVEEILHNKWSDQKILFTVDKPARGYVYAGGMHAGYFDHDDITHGGSKMLVTWTEHTAINPNVPESGYAHKSQVVEFGSIKL